MHRLYTLRNSLIIISVTTLLILGTQVYRTVNNYQLNKQRFINDVQLALDLSVEKYYADKARSHFIAMTMTHGDSITRHVNAISMTMDSLEVDSEFVLTQGDSTITSNGNGFQYSWSTDSEDVQVKKEIKKFKTDSGSGTVVRMTSTELDSMDEFNFAFVDFTQLTQKIMISSSEERMDIDQLNRLLEEELERKSISMGYQLAYGSVRNSKHFPDSHVKFTNYPLATTSKSTYLLPGESLDLRFENATLLILKKGAWDMIVSFAIVFAVISALLYLYRIIENQKELAMIKDDLIGNVTHEFKTPIATASTALEGIANFNDTNDPEKTRRYVDMSRDQLAKLNLMVEKLMETATLDSGEMEVSKIDTDLAHLAHGVVENFQLRVGDKSLTADLPKTEIWAMVDPFHIENVLSNLIDNAIKYGGREITVTMKKLGDRVTFQVIDNGGNIEKAYRQKIFEKLYRIPKGNQHDVKGFGIGLYYTKAIVERHGGKITLDVSPGHTCFTVSL